MKELSIEEKAKRYDEALKYAMIYYKDGNEDMKMMMKTCFPVLVEESEDVVIKEKIIATIHLYYGEPLEDEAKEMIAWLEKQDENNMGISETIKKELEDNLNKALEKETPESWNEFLEKQGEQKKIDYNEELKKCKANPLYFFDKYVKVKFKEQNPAWSEDDQSNFNELSSFILETYRTEDASRLITWLKSLKDRVQTQPKWKPSDEQMADLWNMLCECRPADHQLLQDIYYGLKKLRKE